MHEMLNQDLSTRRPLISRDSVVPIGIAVSVVIVAAVSAWNVSAALSTNTAETGARFRSIEQKLSYIEQKIAAAENWQVTKSDWRTWATLLQANNPDLKVPKIE